MKKLLFSLCFLFACTIVFAQGKYEQVVYLKNGSVIHGLIVEYVPNASIKVKSGPNLFAYKMDEIEKITLEEPAARVYEGKSKGYYGIAQVGLTDFPAGGNLAMASISLINGYQFNRYVGLGLGIGGDISTHKVYNMPVFADLRINFLKTRVTPFVAIDLGYNAQFTQTYDYYSGDTKPQVYHGMVFNPSLGVKVGISKKVGASLALGYKMLGVNASYTSYSYYGYSSTVSSFGLSHGITLMGAIHF